MAFISSWALYFNSFGLPRLQTGLPPPGFCVPTMMVGLRGEEFVTYWVSFGICLPAEIIRKPFAPARKGPWFTKDACDQVCLSPGCRISKLIVAIHLTQISTLPFVTSKPILIFKCLSALFLKTFRTQIGKKKKYSLLIYGKVRANLSKTGSA